MAIDSFVNVRVATVLIQKMSYFSKDVDRHMIYNVGIRARKKK